MSGRSSAPSGRRRGPPEFAAIAPLAGLLLTLFVFVADVIPLGVPGEWVWPRQPLPQDGAELADRLFWPLLAGLLLIAVAMFGELELSRPRLTRIQCVMHLILLTGSTLLWHTAVLQSASSPHRELRPLWVLYDRSASGYFLRTLADRRPLRQFLAEYESEAAKGDVLHAGTHPPGLLLLNRAALTAARLPGSGFGRLAATAVSLQPAEAIDAFRLVETEASLAPRLTDSQFAALALTALGSLLICSLLPGTVYLLTRQFVQERDAWRSAALAAVLPCIDMFQPRSDVLYPTSSLLLLTLLTGSLLQKRLLPRLTLAAIGGFVLAGCLTVSLAHLPILAAAVLFAALHTFAREDWKIGLRQTLVSVGITGATFLCCVLLVQWLTDCSLPRIWRLNLSNHAGFYLQYPRTWWKWLPVNLAEMSLATGLPAMLLVPAALRRALQTVADSSAAARPAGLLCLALTATWCLLWLSGKNMGEAARLWCFAAPWWLVCLSMPTSGSGQAPLKRSNWRLLFVCQLLACTATTALVSGYHLMQNDVPG
ncbi:MAG: hypothetical protein ACK5YC_20770 [Planctomyces sp.]